MSTNETTETATAREQMRTLTLEDIQALAHGESIPRFVGKIKKVWDQRSGTGEYGDWYLQNLVVETEDGEIQVTWTGADAFDRHEWEGATVAFECGENKQGKPVGVMRDVRTAKDGKVYKGVKVTPAGRIVTLTQAPTRIERTEQSVKASTEVTTEQIETLAKQSKAILLAAWEQADDMLEWVLGKDHAMTWAERYDLHLRIAQGIAIDINKTLRRERF